MFGGQKRETYLLLPSSVAVDHARLGRVVTDIYAPGHAFRPRLPKKGPNLQGYSSEPLVQREARGIFKDEKYASIRGQLSDLLHIDFSRESAEDVQWSTGTLTTRTFLNHELYIRELVKNNKEVREFIHEAWNAEDKRNRKEVFLIVGVKEWTDAELETTANTGTNFGGKATVPVGEAAQIPTDKLDASIEGKVGDKKEVSLAGKFAGNAVFAVQYRRIKKSAMTKLVLEEARHLGQSTFSGDEPEQTGQAQPYQVDVAEDDINFELDDPLDEDYLERGDLIYSRVELGNDDLLVQNPDVEEENAAPQG